MTFNNEYRDTNSNMGSRESEQHSDNSTIIHNHDSLINAAQQRNRALFQHFVISHFDTSMDFFLVRYDT
jgi:DNA-binding GntR family transcriptional regulator